MARKLKERTFYSDDALYRKVRKAAIKKMCSESQIIRELIINNL